MPSAVSAKGRLDREALPTLLRIKVAVKPSCRGGTSKAATTFVSIFDWDDTILCTTYLRADGLEVGEDGNLTSRSRHIFGQIEEQACSLLEQALARGLVYIVTNARRSWVEESAKRFLPRLLPLIQKVKVVSARSENEAFYPKKESNWKNTAFMKIAGTTNFHLVQDLLVAGDGLCEMSAATALADVFEDLRLKIVKLKTRPGPRDILEQLKKLSANFRAYADAQRNLAVALASGPRNLVSL